MNIVIVVILIVIERAVMASWGWLYGEQVKESQMRVTSSLPSQRSKTD